MRHTTARAIRCQPKVEFLFRLTNGSLAESFRKGWSNMDCRYWDEGIMELSLVVHSDASRLWMGRSMEDAQYDVL
jgi:hypothetical protein